MGDWGHRSREAEWEPFSLPTRMRLVACVTGPAGPHSRERHGTRPVSGKSRRREMPPCDSPMTAPTAHPRSHRLTYDVIHQGGFR